MIGDVARFTVQAAPDEVALQKAVRCLVDTIGVMIAGSAHPEVRLLEGSLATAPRSKAATGCLWSNRVYRSDDAALLFGMASHVLDYDDVSLLAICHPSAPIIAALVAWSGARAVEGVDFLAAYVIGTEVMIRVGEAVGSCHYGLGFHATATLGTIGATAALARLARLDHQTAKEALNIAASLAGGLQSNFGSSVKSLHVGFAASAAIRALWLAQGGLIASSDAFAPRGFLYAYSGGQVDAWPKAFHLGAPFAIAEPGFEQKRFPCCYMLHRMLAGILALRERHGLALDDVSKVVLSYPTGGTAPLRYPRPASGMQGLFSAPYACISALADGRIDLASFSDTAVSRAAINERLGDVTVVETEQLLLEGGLSTSPVKVEIKLRSGTIVSQLVDHAPGSRDDPLTDDQQSDKWLDCLRQAFPAVDAARADHVRNTGLELATGSLASWFGQVRKLSSAAADQ